MTESRLVTVYAAEILVRAKTVTKMFGALGRLAPEQKDFRVGLSGLR